MPTKLQKKYELCKRKVYFCAKKVKKCEDFNKTCCNEHKNDGESKQEITPYTLRA